MTVAFILLVFSIFFQFAVSVFDDLIDLEVVTPSTFVFWPNATIPFYVNQEHFDREQTLAIMTTLSLFEFKSCLKFSPVLVSPEGSQHVLVFHNPAGKKHCAPSRRAHALNEPHYVPLGYDCLQSPQLEQAVMIALGFPFEHNRMLRDVYVDVQPENVAAGAEEFFTKDISLPVELRNLPYDFDSVMHFGEREFSKNGHRTIIFKNPYTKQQRLGLSPLDVRKIEIVYGAECRTRDRQQKVELCQGFPGVARRKREAEENLDYTRSLRVNPDITPPPEVANNASNSNNNKNNSSSKTELDEHLKQLGVQDEVQDIVDRINKVTATALSKARVKYCNDTKTTILRSDDSQDLLDVVRGIATYTQGILERALGNRTEFCQASESVATYHRSRCGYGKNERCVWNQKYKSTHFGAIRYSTQHRPWIRQSTQHFAVGGRLNNFEPGFTNRATLDNSTEVENVTEKVRRRREVKTPGVDDVKNESVLKTIEDRRYGDSGYRSNDDFMKNEKSRFFSDEDPRKRKKNRNESEERVKKQSRERINDYDYDRNPSRPNYSKNKKNWSDEDKPQKTSYKDNDYDYDHPRKIKNNQKEFVSKYESQERQKQDGRDKNRDSRERVKQFAPVQSRERYSYEPRRPTKKQRYSDEDKNENTNKKYQSQERRKTKYSQNSSPEEENKYSSEEKTESKLSKKKATEPSVWKKKTDKDLPRVVQLTKANREFYNDRKWPDGIVRYFITDQPQYDMDDLRARLEEVNHILKKKTCVRLQEVTPQDGHRDFLALDTSPDYVTGRVGGKQVFGSVELFQGGQHRQHTAMMVMAWLGFYFEVAREDRDKYVRVHMRHVRPDKLHHFELIREDATLPLPYDYASATHPAWQFWRRVGETGISSVATYKDQDPDGSIMKSLGQNEQLLSNIDIIKINSVYGTQCLGNRRKSDASPRDTEKKKKEKMLEPIFFEKEKRKMLEPIFFKTERKKMLEPVYL